MPEACENWLGLYNNCVKYACQTREIYQVLSYSVDSKAPRQLWKSEMNEMNVKLKSDLYAGPVSIISNFDTVFVAC